MGPVVSDWHANISPQDPKWGPRKGLVAVGPDAAPCRGQRNRCKVPRVNRIGPPEKSPSILGCTAGTPDWRLVLGTVVSDFYANSRFQKKS